MFKHIVITYWLSCSCNITSTIFGVLITMSQRHLAASRSMADRSTCPAAEEHLLYRVFDSLAYEDEESHSFETGLNASGDLSAEQTRDIMSLFCNHLCVWLS